MVNQIHLKYKQIEGKLMMLLNMNTKMLLLRKDLTEKLEVDLKKVVLYFFATLYRMLQKILETALLKEWLM